MRAVPTSPAARLRALYFLYYGNVGTYLPFFAVYLQGLGFSGKQIGLIQMLPSFPLAPIVAISWAAFADHRASPQRALRLATGWVAFAVLLLPLARAPWQVALVVLMALGDRAVVPLTDSVTIEYCRDNPGVSYARIRLFGSLGFVALTVAVGRLLTLRGGRPADLLVPLTVVLCVIGYARVARRARCSRCCATGGCGCSSAPPRSTGPPARPTTSSSASSSATSACPT